MRHNQCLQNNEVIVIGYTGVEGANFHELFQDFGYVSNVLQGTRQEVQG